MRSAGCHLLEDGVGIGMQLHHLAHPPLAHRQHLRGFLAREIELLAQEPRNGRALFGRETVVAQRRLDQQHGDGHFQIRRPVGLRRFEEIHQLRKHFTPRTQGAFAGSALGLRKSPAAPGNSTGL